MAKGKKKEKKRKDKTQLWKTLLIAGLFLGGLAVFFYPMLASWYNGRVQYDALDSYEKYVDRSQIDFLQEELATARRYNEALLKGEVSVADPFSEDQQAFFARLKKDEYPRSYRGDSPIGAISIPKIACELPIYLGVADTTLSRGVGLMTNSSLPVGGKGTHAILTGHRGLPSSELFRYLNELKEGDDFYLSTLGEKFCYRVDQILLVKPEEMDALRIVKDRDFVTLITCDPYMINSHRLLVRGERQALSPAVGEASTEIERLRIPRASRSHAWQLLIKRHPLESAVLALLLLIFLIFIIMSVRKRRRRGRKLPFDASDLT